MDFDKTFYFVMVEFQDFPSKILLHYRCSFHLSHVVFLSLLLEKMFTLP